MYCSHYMSVMNVGKFSVEIRHWDVAFFVDVFSCPMFC